MNRFDVSVYAIRRRAGRPPAVRGPLAGGGPTRSKSFITRRPRRQLPGRTDPRCPDGPGVRSADRPAGRLEPPGTRDRHLVPGGHRLRRDEMADPGRSLPGQPGRIAGHSGHARSPTRPGARDRPDQRELHTALYQHAFNPARPAGPGGSTCWRRSWCWAQQASLPVGCLSEPAVLRSAVEALTLRLDGSRAAANTIIRKRAVLHGALGYAAEAGLLPNNPLDTIGWQVPRSSAALDPWWWRAPPRSAHCWTRLPGPGWSSPPSSAACTTPRFARRKPSPCASLTAHHLPGPGMGMLRLSAATPRTASPHGPTAAPAMSSADSSTGRTGRSGWSQSPRFSPPCSAPTSRPTAAHPTAGCSGEPAAGRSANRSTAVPGTPPVPSPSGPNSPPAGIARRPYDLRHAALSLWLNAVGTPPRSPPGPGTASPSCSPSTATASTAKTNLLNQQIGHVLEPSAGRGPCPSVGKPAVVPTPRDGRGRRPRCVRAFPSRPADGPWTTPTLNGHTPKQQPWPTVVSPESRQILELDTNSGPLPDPAHGWPKDLHQRSAEPLPWGRKSR